MSEQVLKANTPENPYGVDVIIKSEGPMKTITCQFCPQQFSGPLHRARGQLLDHYEQTHHKAPEIHSFFQKENRSEAERLAWGHRGKVS